MQRVLMRWFAVLLVLTVGVVPLASARQVSVHDPVLAREGDTYYLFSTGPGITIYRSPDLQNFRLCGRVFSTEPTWARDVVPRFNGHIWAPDISQHDGTWYLYYSVSRGGKNTSAIGVATNRTLDPDSADYRWVDHGIVIRSIPGRDLWNAIDPNLAWDDQGTPWLAFGSFWSGIKLVRMDPGLTAIAVPQEWHAIAKRERSVFVDDLDPGPAEIEAPFIFPKGGYYYLFVSWDKCCRGAASNYKIAVGRSRTITGPYVDREGRPMNEGGGTLVLAGDPAWPGAGHCGVYTFDGRDIMVFHAYEAADNGLQKLKIADITWDADQWPVVDPAVLHTYTSTLIGPEPVGMKPPPEEPGS